MRVELAYGHTTQAADVAEQNFLGSLTARHLTPASDVAAVVRDALKNPIGVEPFDKVIKPDRAVTIVIGDTTRSWARQDLYVLPIIDELNRLGVPDKSITVVSGTGTHRQQTEEERRALVGNEVLRRVRFVDHDCHDKSSLVYVGTTSRGTEVRVNRAVAEAEQLIISGGVVQHFLAGYGGGRKAIIPGIAAYETIQANHKLSLSAKRGEGLLPSVNSLVADGNVVHEDMTEAAALLNPCFGISIVVNEDMQIAKVLAGHWKTAFQSACEIVRDTICCEIDELADLVVVSNGGYPKDITMWQSSKTIDNAARAVRPGGVVVWLARCDEGLGAEEFVVALEEAANTQEAEALMRRNFTIGALVTYVIQKHASNSRVLIVTDLEEGYCRRLGLEKVPSLADGLSIAYAQLGAAPKTYLMAHGGATVPLLKSQPVPTAAPH